MRRRWAWLRALLHKDRSVCGYCLLLIVWPEGNTYHPEWKCPLCGNTNRERMRDVQRA